MRNPQGHPEPDFEPPPTIPSNPRTSKKKVSSKLNRWSCLDFLEMRQLHQPKSLWEWVCSLAPPLLTSCVISYLTAL
ncbi:hypothetical protein Bca4012_007825 [Brassica carinata]